MSDALLQISRLNAGYDETVVLEDINLSVAQGESVSIIGRNGVGKSTLLATLMGHTTQHSGEIKFAGQVLNALKPYERTWAGLGFVPQEREIFASLSVLENLQVADREGGWTVERVLDLFGHLKSRLTNMGNQLSGGEQQMLAIGRALMTNPQLLLMDEPSEGLAPVIVEQLQHAMTRLREEEAMTIVLVEQNSRVALAFSQRCIVMNRGQIVVDTKSERLANNPDELERLIGVDAVPAGHTSG